MLLVEDCEWDGIINANHPEVVRRYWIYECQSGLNIWDYGIDEAYDAIEECKPNLGEDVGAILIDRGKLEQALKFFYLDESTYLTGFLARDEEIVELARTVSRYQCDHGRLCEAAPDAGIFSILWIDGWWELQGRRELLTELINPDRIYVEVPDGIKLNDAQYGAHHCALQRKIEQAAGGAP